MTSQGNLTVLIYIVLLQYPYAYDQQTKKTILNVFLNKELLFNSDTYSKLSSCQIVVWILFDQ